MNSPDPGAFPFPTSERHDAPPAEPVRPVEQPTTEDALDHGIEESFPASDPVSVNVTKAKAAPVPPASAGHRHGPAAGASPLRHALLSGLTTGAVAGVACSIALAPRRRRGGQGSTAWVLGAFAAGMALGCATAQGRRRGGEAPAPPDPA